MVGSAGGTPAGQQPRQRGGLGEPWQTSTPAQGVEDGVAALALPHRAGVGVPPPALRLAAVPQHRKSWKIYFSNETHISAALLTLRSPSHVALQCKTHPKRSFPRMLTVLTCGKAGISSPQEMLLQIPSWLPRCRNHPSPVTSAQLSQGWKPTMSKLEHAPGRGRQDLLHPHQLLPGAGLLGRLHSPAGRGNAAWSPAGLPCEAMPCCCGQPAAGDQQQVR